MAIIQKGILGGLQGKVGTVVGASWRDIYYLRSLPKRTKRAPSPRQLKQQRRFLYGVRFIRRIVQVINRGYAGYPMGNNSAFSETLSILLKEGLSGEYPDYQIDLEKIPISKGRLLPLQTLQWNRTEQGDVKLTWHYKASTLDSGATDKLIVLLYAPALHRFELFEPGERKSQSVELKLHPEFRKTTLKGWLFLRNIEDTQSSDSQYLSMLKEVTPKPT